VQNLLRSSYGAVIFVSKNFTAGFLDKNGRINANHYRTEKGPECVTVYEIIEIERNLQERDGFELHIVNLDGTVFNKKDNMILESVFRQAGILKDDSVAHFVQRNLNPFYTARDHEDSFFNRMVGSYLPNDISVISHGNLGIGNYTTTIDTLCWDTKQFIQADQIVFELEGCDLPLYDKIEYSPFHSEPLSQDDDVVSVVQFEQSLTSNEERKHLLMRCKLIKYHLFKKTLDLWDRNGFSMTKEIARFLNSDEDTRLYPIPNAMGLALMVVSSDNKLVFSRRSTKRRVRSNEFDCSIVEGLLPFVDKTVGGEKVSYSYADPDYIQNECRRAFCEEICAANDLIVNLFGLILDRKYGQWNLAGLIRTGLTSEQIKARHATRDDTTEKNRLYFVDYTDTDGALTIAPIRDAIKLFRQDGLWDTALAVVFGTLSALGFDRETIDTVLQ
jgi:hypothetical protein